MGCLTEGTVAIVVVCSLVTLTSALNVVWSVNAGGDKHTDAYGIR